MGRALLLNASFEPLCVVPMRRAVVLVLKEKAEIVARNGAVLHSERAELPVPAVIRLHHFVRVPYRNDRLYVAQTGDLQLSAQFVVIPVPAELVNRHQVSHRGDGVAGRCGVAAVEVSDQVQGKAHLQPVQSGDDLLQALPGAARGPGLSPDGR